MDTYAYEKWSLTKDNEREKMMSYKNCTTDKAFYHQNRL